MAIPTTVPTPAVNTIARAPQNVTLPAPAPSASNTARNSREAMDTTATSHAAAETSTLANGVVAPLTANCQLWREILRLKRSETDSPVQPGMQCK